MLKRIIIVGAFFLALTVKSQNEKPVEITILGTFHFTKFHNETGENTNFYSEKKQKEINEILEALGEYNPDRIYIEREKKYQKGIDSLFDLYNKNKLKLSDFENGSGEVYQIGFQLAKQLQHETLYCVNHFESVSQELISDGHNISYYEKALKQFKFLGRDVVTKFLKGEATLMETLRIMNLPENIEMSHNMMFNTPAYVQNGEFKSYENLPENTSNIDKKYIGAEFISLFYERNLKIYSNILNEQLNSGGDRILLITGQVHVGVLQELLKKNPNFKVVEIFEYLK